MSSWRAAGSGDFAKEGEFTLAIRTGEGFGSGKVEGRFGDLSEGAALGGGRGDLELGGDLVGSEALVVAEDDELAVFFGEGRKGLVELGGKLGFRV
jgi:hypothetical protein